MKTNRAVGLVALALVAACATQAEVLMHRTHRLNYALQPEELERMQFYISTNVLAHHGAVTNSALYLTDEFIELDGELTEMF